MNNKKKIAYIVGFSAFALIGLVVIQIIWIKQAAELREDQFNHRVSMALYRTVDKLSKDKATCMKLNSTFNSNAIIAKDLRVEGIEEKAKIDSLLRRAFATFHVELAYDFTIVNHVIEPAKAEQTAPSQFINTPYKFNLEPAVEHSDLELRVVFPNKKKHIFAEMSMMLAGSVIFILLITACFVITIFTIMQQKKLAEMTTDFINNMTHELKTPIATISLASNMLRKDRAQLEPEKVKRYANMIHDENTKLEMQVERVLEMARLERGEIKLQKQHIDLHEVVKSSIQAIELQVHTRQGQITSCLNATHSLVLADAMHLSNIISNLLDNANKYSPTAPEITVSTRDEENGVVICVEDKGIGMTKDKQKNIFEKFYRVSTGNLHDVKGFGLGLSYVKMMVDAHKGMVKIQSELGKGSRFEVFLPTS